MSRAWGAFGSSRGMARFLLTFFVVFETVDDPSVTVIVGYLSAWTIAMSNGSSGKGTSSLFFFRGDLFFLFFFDFLINNVSCCDSLSGGLRKSFSRRGADVVRSGSRLRLLLLAFRILRFACAL